MEDGANANACGGKLAGLTPENAANAAGQVKSGLKPASHTAIAPDAKRRFYGRGCLEKRAWICQRTAKTCLLAVAIV